MFPHKDKDGPGGQGNNLGFILYNKWTILSHKGIHIVGVGVLCCHLEFTIPHQKWVKTLGTPFLPTSPHDGSWHPESLLSRGLHNLLPRQGNIAHISPTVDLPIHNMLYVPL